jgi:subtilisin family serine protease
VSHAGRGVTVDAFDGTSMAAPFVSALAAMLIAQNPTWTPAEVRAAIVETVRPIPSLDVASGGLIDAAAALARARQ